MTYGYAGTHSPGRPRSGAKALAIVLTAMALSFAFAGGAALAAMKSQIDRGPAGFGSGQAHLAFTDGTGRVLLSSHIDATEGAPEAAVSSIPIGIWNEGPFSSTYKVSVEHVRSPARSPLTTPRVDVRDPSGVVIYSGMLSEMQFEGPSLDPGDSRTYLISISWPHELASEQLQEDRSLSFDLHGIAEPTDG